MKIYADPRSVNCRKVFAGLKLMGIDFQQEYCDFFEGDHKSPEYVAMNPNGSMPTLVDEDFILWESNAILQYAADKSVQNTLLEMDKMEATIQVSFATNAGTDTLSCILF